MSVPEWQLAGYENLRIEIIRQAVNDYMSALAVSQHNGEKCRKQIMLEKFFLSPWGQTLSGNVGEQIIEQCRRGSAIKPKRGRREIRSEEEQRRIARDYANGVTRKAILQSYRITDEQLYRYVRKWG
jgi:hypothetical protein